MTINGTCTGEACGLDDWQIVYMRSELSVTDLSEHLWMK